MKSLTGKFTSVRGWTLLLALLLGAGMMISACGDEEVPTPTTPAPTPAPTPTPTPTPEPTPEPTGPATPTGLRISASGANFLEWTWTAVEGVLGYQGQFSTDAVFADNDQTFLIIAPQTSHRASNLSANTSGHFRVRSGTGSLTALTYSEWTDGVTGTTSAPPPAVPLSAPTGLRTGSATTTTVTLTWSSVDDADSYDVEQRPADGQWTGASCNGGDSQVDNEACEASGLTRGTDYSFRVRAQPDPDDDTLEESAWSSTASARTSGSTPSTSITGTDDAYEITWESGEDTESDANNDRFWITWTWSRPDDGRIRFLYTMIDIDENTANEREACPAIDGTWTGGPDGLPQYSYTTATGLTAGHVARLCVVPTWKDDDAQRYGDVFSAWAATAPETNAAVGDIALGPKVNSDQQKTTAIDWYVQVDQAIHV